MATKTVSKLIEQGYMIIDANTKYVGESWVLTPALAALFNPGFINLRDAQAVVENVRIEKEALAKRNRDERVNIEHTLARLKQFILVVADEETAQAMFHTLGIDDDYPNKDEDFVTIIMSTVLPHLDDWDGTPEEISAAIKTEVNTGGMEFADATRDNIEKQAESTTATADRDQKRDIYEDVLTRIRNWLYLMLPGEKYDSHLDEYGFEIWDKPSSGEPEEPEEPLIPWPGPAEFEVENLGGGTVELRPQLIEDMVDGIIERRIDPAAPWEIITDSIEIEDGKVIPHRDLNAPMGMMIEYRFTPLNAAMEKGLETIVAVNVE